ncbi:MAG TPA: right-handed parallel beta-helix repeat-containing protein [Phycisphaerae bacterium]|nr:right-handed parallel beta-helix repeat-containing protein [Phycisphaerae bacterium]
MSRRAHHRAVVAIFACFFSAAATNAQTIWYVDDDAPAGGDGQSWGTAYQFLQDALVAAAVSDEIRVAQGTYRPDRDAAHPGGTGDRHATFQLKNGVALYGGYAGVGSADPDQRDTATYESVLSGDMGCNDVPSEFPYGSSHTENSYHVVTASGTVGTAVLDGFVVTAGHADEFVDFYDLGPDACGGGMYTLTGSPTLYDCTFRANFAYSGAGIYSAVGSNPILVDVTFNRNWSGGDGGGMSNANSSGPLLTGCLFSENYQHIEDTSWIGSGAGFLDWQQCNAVLIGCTFAGNVGQVGGGMACFESNPQVIECLFTGNRGIPSGGGEGIGGGGILSYYSSPVISGCVIIGNRAGTGGGVYSYWRSSPTIVDCVIADNVASYGAGVWCEAAAITNCIITRNMATQAGAVNCDSATINNCTIIANTSRQYGGGVYCDSGTPTLTNCILWGNAAQTGKQAYLDYSSGLVTISYCNIQGGQAGVYAYAGRLNWGSGNIDADPSFALAEDYHLLANSLCIDTGTNTPPGGLHPTDKDGVARPLDGDGVPGAIADMGAYELAADAPCIAFSPGWIEASACVGGPDVRSQTVFVRNSGGGTLHWSIAEDCPWLGLTPAAGMSTDNVDSITLSFLTAGLSIGTYIYPLTIADEAAVNTPRMVHVILHVGVALRVPEQYATIQAAIDAARDYDWVVVADGTYTGTGNQDLDFKGKAITVRSQNGPAACIIDCAGSGRGFYFHTYETSAAVIDGLTITRANSSGIVATSGSPTIRDCVICGNSSSSVGGGISCITGTILNCTICGNMAVTYGGGVFGDTGELRIGNCLIASNSGRYGGGISSSGRVDLVNCTIAGNSVSSWGGGVCARASSTVSMLNSILWGNTASTGPQAYLTGTSPVLTVAYSDVQGAQSGIFVSVGSLNWGTGNINANPAFLDPDGPDNDPATWQDNNYHLRFGSPCINAGDPNGSYAGSTDMDGGDRVVGGRVDIGADEFFLEVQIPEPPPQPTGPPIHLPPRGH